MANPTTTNGGSGGSSKKHSSSTQSAPTSVASPPPGKKQKAVSSKVSDSSDASTPYHSKLAGRNLSAAFSKKETTSPLASHNGSPQGKFAQAHRIKSCRTSGGTAIVATCKSYSGTAGFLNPLVKFINKPENESLVLDKCKIHYVTSLRDPNDPEAYLEDPPIVRRNGTCSDFRPRYMVFVSFLPECSAHKNTPQMRRDFCENICSINNHDTLQHTYDWPGPRNLLVYDGDLTPASPAESPKLSKFLTIRDVWVCIMNMLKDPETFMAPPAQEVLEDEELLLDYYDEDLLALVKQRYSPQAKPIEEFEKSLSLKTMEE